MYARHFEKDGKEQTVTLAVSGMLWNRSLVMIDSETKSLWSQLLGKAMRGKLEGVELELLPGLMTDWKTWRTRHPDTTVVTLPRTARQFVSEVYQRPEHFGIGLARGSHARFWSFDQLLKQPVINEEFRESPLVIAFVPKSGTAFIYDRRLDDQTLSFSRKEDRLVDDQTHSTWEVTSGLAIDGPLSGRSLKLVPGIVSFPKAWKQFHPESEYYQKAP